MQVRVRFDVRWKVEGDVCEAIGMIRRRVGQKSVGCRFKYVAWEDGWCWLKEKREKGSGSLRV